MTMSQLLQPFVLVNMHRWMNQNKSDVLSAVVARWKRMPVDASYFVFLRMLVIVNDAINSRLRALLAGLKFFASIGTHGRFFNLGGGCFSHLCSSNVF